MIHLQDSSSSTPARCSKRLRFSHLLHDESGQDLIEYALVAALVGLAAVGAMRGLSMKISTAFNSVGNNMTSAL